MIPSELRDLARRLLSPDTEITKGVTVERTEEKVIKLSVDGDDPIEIKHDVTVSGEEEVTVSVSDVLTDYEIGLIRDALEIAAQVAEAERFTLR